MTSVLSIAVPPVDRLPVERRYTTAALLRHRLEGEAGRGEHLVGLVVELEARQHLLVPDAAARVLVDDLDQLREGMHAVTHHVSGQCAGLRPPERR